MKRRGNPFVKEILNGKILKLATSKMFNSYAIDIRKNNTKKC
jgi:hypothetical protein